jgi:hypothetical protein
VTTEIKFAGAFGYVAEGLSIQQVCALTAGSVHTVAYTTSAKTVAGSVVTEFDPRTARIYTYSQVRRACQKARTEERLYGTMSLVGPAGGMTRFGIELGRMKPKTTLEWLTALAFEGVDPQEVYSKMLDMYPEEVNES